jgi:hypothetical protein
MGKKILTKNDREHLKNVERGTKFKTVIQYNKNHRDELARLCDVYGSDKGELISDGHPYPWSSHNYTDYYSRLFNHCRNYVTKVFECGLGTNNPALASSMGASGKPGASLRVWRDYFPNAKVYGADIDTDILFQEDRIETFYIDQLNPEAINAFWKKVGETNFDFMVDDGLHTFVAGSTLFTHSIEKLSQSGIYIIEDVTCEDLEKYKDFFKTSEYQVEFVTLYRPDAVLFDNNLVVIRK